MFAQGIPDAVRLAEPTMGIGARAIGMGSAFMPVADDYSAIFWNPAGLGQLKFYEVSGGLAYNNYDNSASFFGNTQAGSASSYPLTQLGVVMPARVGTMGFTFALGFNTTANYTTTTQFSGYNPNSSLVNYETTDPTGFLTVLPFNTGVAGYNSSGVATTPIKGDLQQVGNLQESGMMHTFSAGFGAELSPNLFAGATLNFYSGTYNYNRTYTETDVNGLNKNAAVDTTNWTSMNMYQYYEQDQYSQDIGGFGAIIGFLYAIPNTASIGVTITTPTVFSVTESDNYAAQASFWDNTVSPFAYQQGGSSFDVTTPFIFSLGAAVHPIPQLTISADADFIDYTQLQFSNAPSYLTDLNQTIQDSLHAVVNLRGGAELKLPFGMGIRAGVAYLPSPYTNDPSNYNQLLLTGGLSFIVAKQGAIDVAFVSGNFHTFQSNYDSTSQTASSINTTQVLVNFSYRFF